MTHDILTNFGFSVLALIICLTSLWLISLKMRDASIIDIFWGAGFGIVAMVCLYLAQVKTDYILLLTALPAIWAVRLSVYLAKRNLGHGEDKRYVFMQQRAEKKGLSEMAWRKRALWTIFYGQGFLIMIVSAPIWVATATGSATTIGTLALIGASLWLVGFLFEAIGDWQLARFLKKNGDYDGPIEEKPVLNTGLWRYTRHPNYFGNACMWWGIFLIACQAPWGWLTLLAPVIMTLLLVRVSGKDLLERSMKKRKTYMEYVKRTPGFVPWFPKSHKDISA